MINFPSLAAATRRLPEIQPPASNGAFFTNPKPVHKVWDPGVQYTGTITVPAGYENTITWQIIQHESFTVETSGTGQSVAYAFPYKGADKVNTYALLVHATKSGRPDLWMLCPGEFTIMKTFTRAQADRIITMSGTSVTGGSSSSDWTDYASWSGGTKHGFKIWLEGTYTGTGRPVNFFYWRSSDPMNPVQVIADNATINTTIAQSFPMGSNQNFVFTGCNNEAVQYGLKVNKTAGGVGENIYLTPSDSTHESYNWTFCGVHVDNGTYTNGGTGLAVQMTNNAVFNGNTYTFDRFTMFNMLIENANNEAMYTGHTRDTDSPPFVKLSHCLYYRCNSNHSRNEGFQIGGHTGAEVFLCNWLDSGLGAEGGQDNNFQFAYGNKDLYCYMNYSQTNHSLIQQFPSITGRNTEVFANIFETKFNNVFANKYFIRLSQSTTYPDITYSCYNNMIRVVTGPCFQLNNDPNVVPTTIFKFLADGNTLISDTPTNYTLGGGFNFSNSLMNNVAVLNSNIASMSFFNESIQDYRITSLSAPVFGFTRNSTAVAARVHPWADYDHYGFKYVATNLACGHDSGFLLMTGNSGTTNIASVASIADITGVPNGTSFATLQSTYLPASVLCTMADASLQSLAITWAQGSYNGTTGGTFALNGTLTLPGGVTNTGNLQAHVNVTVAAPAVVVSEKVNLSTGAAAGWFATGAVGPTGSGTIDYGVIGSSGIGIRALNSVNKQWSGTSNNGGTNSTVFPGAVQQTYWYNFAVSGADFELYNVPAGTYTLQFLCARASIAGPRMVRVSAQSGQTGVVNAANNANNLIVLSGVTPIGGVIRITVAPDAPNDNGSGLLSGFTLDSM